MNASKQPHKGSNKEPSTQSAKRIYTEKDLASLRSSIFEMGVLNELAVAATKVISSEQMLDLIVKKSMKAVDAEQGSILRVSKSENKVVSTLVRQDDNSKLKHSYNVLTKIIGWVLLNRKSLFIEKLSTEDRFKTNEKETKEIHSVICIPVWYSGEIIGILMMINKKCGEKFNQSDLDLLSIIAIQAGQLIKNAQLQEEALLKSKQAEIARIEKEKITELDELKTRFFTNISHDFRTPLTLIIEPLNKLLADKKSKEYANTFNLMKQNADQLFRLINQLMDLSKLESGGIKVQLIEKDVVGFIKGLISNFQSLADEEDIGLKFQSGEKTYLASFDTDKFERIVFNLLSNALKFTSAGGFVYINLSFSKKKARGNLEQSDHIVLVIRDNGIGIPEKDLKHIFDRFYQSESAQKSIRTGTGLGLALVKQLVNFLKGEISIKSVEDEGTEIIVSLPLGKAHLNEGEFIIEKVGEYSSKVFENYVTDVRRVKKQLHGNTSIREVDPDSEHKILLIVEDNDDLRSFIAENFKDSFSVIQAMNGEIGYQSAIDEIPDIIVSDVVMPEMNGIELCTKIKENEKTSHIPIILLTAKVAVEDKFKGLETGADDYITKPFNIRELSIRINNLIDQRRKLRERFSKEFQLKPKDIIINSVDERFLEKAKNIIEENIANALFSVEDFAGEVGLSTMQLYRKVTALTNLSPNEFIKFTRLTRAKELILKNFGNISEIAYEVGFNNPSYFSECFRTQFGCSPSQLKKTQTSITIK